MKLQFNTSPQAGINLLLYDVAPEAEFKHGCKGFDCASDMRGLCCPCVAFTYLDFMSFAISLSIAAVFGHLAFFRLVNATGHSILSRKFWSNFILFLVFAFSFCHMIWVAVSI